MTRTGGGKPPRKRATLRTISELTGLSQSTISLSLRGGTALKEETRRRIAEAAASVGYVPDRAGVRLRTGADWASTSRRLNFHFEFDAD